MIGWIWSSVSVRDEAQCSGKQWSSSSREEGEKAEDGKPIRVQVTSTAGFGDAVVGCSIQKSALLDTATLASLSEGTADCAILVNVQQKDELRCEEIFSEGLVRAARVEKDTARTVPFAARDLAEEKLVDSGEVRSPAVETFEAETARDKTFLRNDECVLESTICCDRFEEQRASDFIAEEVVRLSQGTASGTCTEGRTAGSRKPGKEEGRGGVEGEYYVQQVDWNSGEREGKACMVFDRAASFFRSDHTFERSEMRFRRLF